MKVLWFNNKNHLNKIEESQKLADIFHDICMLLTEVRSDGYGYDDVLDARIKRDTGYPSSRWIDNEELAEKLIELKDEMKIALIKARKDGIAEGKNLLKQLNDGSITLKEFDSI
jgi:hypothetical protein